MGPKTNKHAQEAKERESAKKESQQVIAPARTHFILDFVPFLSLTRSCSLAGSSREGR
jgi:hypothetical protein